MTHVNEVQTSDTAFITELKGEVRALRAYFYIRLASLFGDVPLVTTEITFEESKNLKRDPVSSIWDFISTELTESANLLPVNQKDKGRMTKGAALGLKARAMLFAGRYQEAADAAIQSMNGHQHNERKLRVREARSSSPSKSE